MRRKLTARRAHRQGRGREGATRVAEEEAQKRREEEELRKQDPENTPEVVQKPKVKLISALMAARFTARATGEDDGGDLRKVN